MIKRITLLAIIFFIAVSAFPQKRKAQKAYDAFTAGEYFEAIDFFKDAFSKTRDRAERAELTFMVAECYRLTNDPKNAETWYKKISGKDYAKPYATFLYAESLRKNGKYEDAIEEYNNYKRLVPADSRADLGIRSCELAMEWMDSPEPYTVDEIKDLNSRRSDFAASYARDDFGLVFLTSSRDEATGKNDHGATGQNFTDIFESRLDKKGKWSTPIPVDGINTEFEEGAPSFTSDFREVYFTRCTAGKRENKGCQIFSSRIEGNGWGEPRRLRYLQIHLLQLTRQSHPTDWNCILFQTWPTDSEARISTSSGGKQKTLNGPALKTWDLILIPGATNCSLSYVKTDHCILLLMAI